MRNFAAIPVFLALTLVAVACGSANTPAPQTGVQSLAPASTADSSVSALREDALTGLTANVIVPRFRQAASEMESLYQSLTALCAAPSTGNLQQARTQWRAARAQWLRSQAFWFGPVMDRRSRSLVDWSPVDPSRIEEALTQRDSVSAFDVREFLSAAQRGMGAIEYLIFPHGDAFPSDADILEALSPPDGIRCQYLTALGEVVAAEMDGVLADWSGNNPEGKSYAAYFDGTATISLVNKGAVDELVRASVFLSRSVTDMQLGAVLGVDGAPGDPSAIPGGAGYDAIAGWRNQIMGMEDVYLGRGPEASDGMGLSAVVRGLSPEADTRVRNAFTEAVTALDALREPLADTIANDPAPARAAHARLQELRLALNTEVVSLLGVSVGFADTDGDGG